MLTDRLALKLQRRDPEITADELDALAAAVSHYVDVAPDADMVRAGEVVDVAKLLVEGWAFRYSEIPDGRRQILALHIGGDFVDLHSFPLKRMDHSVAALTPCRIAIVPHANLVRISERRPHLTRLLWLSTLIDAAILRQWLTSMGARSAVERAAHLLCELLIRLEVVELGRGDGLRLPLTQAELADVLGISPVHTGRVVAELRARRLVTWRGERIEVVDRVGLERLAQFDPTYLALERRPR